MCASARQDRDEAWERFEREELLRRLETLERRMAAMDEWLRQWHAWTAAELARRAEAAPAPTASSFATPAAPALSPEPVSAAASSPIPAGEEAPAPGGISDAETVIGVEREEGEAAPSPAVPAVSPESASAASPAAAPPPFAPGAPGARPAVAPPPAFPSYTPPPSLRPVAPPPPAAGAAPAFAASAAPGGASPAPGRAEFLSPSEYRGGAPARVGESLFSAPAEVEEPVERVSWEVRLATVWLPRVGGALLLLGLAWVAKLIAPSLGPAARVAAGYLGAALVAGAGWWVMRKSEAVGRVTLSIGLAAAFFVSFASGFLGPMKCWGAPPAIALMLLFTAAVAVLADRWRSEAAAGLGYGLGVLAALASADTSREFALVALGVLALGAGWTLIRHEWLRLTAVALAVAYLAPLGLWLLAPLEGLRGEILSHLGALVVYHLIFTVAFWRWGRVWVARERAAEEAELHDAAPRLELPALPYSTQFAILNSVGLAALSLFLFWHTKTLWPQVHILLFALAAGELTRLVFAGLRRGGLAGFHGLSGCALTAGGVIAAFAGLAESAVMAVMTLAIAVAASRARPLRFLRPLTLITAGLALLGYRGGSGMTRPLHLVAALAPGVLLLASTLPWERIWTRRARAFAPWGALKALDLLSGMGRSAMAAGLCGALLLTYFTGRMEKGIALQALSLALLLFMALLRADAWWLAAVLATLTCLGYHFDFERDNLMLRAEQFIWLLLALYLWQEIGRQGTTRRWSVLLWVGWAPLLALAFLTAIHALDPAKPWWGLGLAGVAAALWAFGRLTLSAPPMPTLIRPEEPEEERWDTPGKPRETPPVFLAQTLAVPLALAAVAIAVLEDARHALYSPAILTLALLAGWVYFTSRLALKPAGEARGGEDAGAGGAALLRSNAVREGVFVAAAAGVAIASLLVFGRAQAWSVFAAAVCAMAFAFAGAARASLAAVAAGAVGLQILPVISGARLIHWPPDTRAAVLWGLGFAALLALAPRAWPWMRDRLRAAAPEDDAVEAVLGPVSRAWPVIAGAGLALAYLTFGSYVQPSPLPPPTLVTVAWGAVAALLLAGGFVFLDRAMRYVAIAVLVAAVGRILLHDLTGVSPVTRAVASLGVGALLIGAGVAYGFLRGRLLSAVDSSRGRGGDSGPDKGR